MHYQIPSRIATLWSAAAVCLALAAGPAAAGEPAGAPTEPAPLPEAPAAAPQPLIAAGPTLQAAAETACVSFRDGGTHVTLCVPVALHRGANAFRLYGSRPMTLTSRDRRRDLYRDAFLELATRSHLAPAPNVWAPINAQWSWLQGSSSGAAGLNLRADALGTLTQPAGDAARAAEELIRKAGALPGFNNLAALSRSLGQKAIEGAGPLDLAQPFAATLQLRALATDQAEARLTQLGQALHPEAQGADPALRDGYRAARAEFAGVRQGLWPALAGSLRNNGGRLLLSAVKGMLLSNLGTWAIFGHLGFLSADSALNAEYAGQYTVCLATLAVALQDAASRTPDYAPLAVYADFALTYGLTEALKDGQVMALKPAGGRSAAEWQIILGGRCAELRKALAN